jgi:hypothetical protein
MPRDRLRQLVARLHEELNQTGELDAEARERLQQLGGDIERLISREEPPPEHRESAAEQVEEAAARFQAQHPRLAVVLEEIMDSLGKLGI